MLSAGCEEEVEIRACCVHATEELRSLLVAKTGNKVRQTCLKWTSETVVVSQTRLTRIGRIMCVSHVLNLLFAFAYAWS